MSLNGVITTASAALLQTQFQISVVNSNVANADDPNYARKITSTTGVLGQVSLTRSADSYLTEALLSATSTAGRDAAVDDLLALYDAALGATSGDDDISSLLSTFSASLTALSSSPSDSSAKSQVISDAAALADGLRDLSAAIQDLRGQADAQIASAVDEINSTLETLSALNNQISRAGAGDVSDLEDQRQAALQTLAGQIDVSYYYDSSNRLVVYSGGELLLGSSPATLSFQASSSVGADAEYPGTLSGVTVGGRDITASISGGSLAGLISLRDDILPAEQDKLDAFATALISQVNGAVAEGSSYPPPSTLTGASPLAETDALNGSGALSLVLTDASGKAVSTTSLDLADYATLDDLVAALDGVSGLGATLSADGKLSLTADDASQGVAVSSTGTTVGGGGQSFAAFFNFNAVFTGADASDIAVSSTLAATPGALATSKVDATATTGAIAVSSGDASAISTLRSALSGATTFPAAGEFAARTSSLASYASDFVSAAAGKISKAASKADASQAAADNATARVQAQSGVNIDEELALLTAYQNQYAATAQLITSARTMFDALLSMVQ